MSCLNEKNWICFICDPNPIEPLRQEYIQLNDALRRSITDTVSPEGASATIDIPSPFVAVDDVSHHASKRSQKRSGNPSQDLDEILHTYEKQIQASLELEDANVPSIIEEINSIETSQLPAAINSLKKCLSAFASDLTNLEARVAQAVTSDNPATLIKLTSLLRILIQHHIFNRLSHPKARIRDDSKSLKRNASLAKSKQQQQKLEQQRQMVLIMDKEWLSDPKKLRLTMERVGIDLSKRSTIIENYKMKNDSEKKRSGGSSSSSLTLGKRKSEDFMESKADRQRRSLTTPSWLSDFKVEKENDDGEAEENEEDEGDKEEKLCMNYEDDGDEEWTDYRILRHDDVPKRRGRPPKYPNFVKPIPTLSEMVLSHMDMPKRGRGRPRKILTLNDKQPRFYVPKLNGETLCTFGYGDSYVDVSGDVADARDYGD